MKAEQVIGAVGMSTMTIRPGDTSVAQGINDLPVVASNNILNLMESACTTSIIEFLDFGETTITENFKLELIGAVGVGSEIRATVRCASFENNILSFESSRHSFSFFRHIEFPIILLDMLVCFLVLYLQLLLQYLLIFDEMEKT
jgi:predicted thioesterase